ncbi:type II restriction endonuclease [Klebsiella pneumoniae]|nr:type II restriction endonuclease [Klebsiella pneumoniae]
MKPDPFRFRTAYHDTGFVENLRMLAVKTTCKDRWRRY